METLQHAALTSSNVKTVLVFLRAFGVMVATTAMTGLTSTTVSNSLHQVRITNTLKCFEQPHQVRITNRLFWTASTRSELLIDWSLLNIYVLQLINSIFGCAFIILFSKEACTKYFSLFLYFSLYNYLFKVHSDFCLAIFDEAV